MRDSPSGRKERKKEGERKKRVKRQERGRKGKENEIVETDKEFSLCT